MRGVWAPAVNNWEPRAPADAAEKEEQEWQGRSQVQMDWVRGKIAREGVEKEKVEGKGS